VASFTATFIIFCLGPYLHLRKWHLNSNNFPLVTARNVKRLLGWFIWNILLAYYIGYIDSCEVCNMFVSSRHWKFCLQREIYLGFWNRLKRWVYLDNKNIVHVPCQKELDRYQNTSTRFSNTFIVRKFGRKLTFPNHFPASTLYKFKLFFVTSTHTPIPFPQYIYKLFIWFTIGGSMATFKYTGTSF